MSTHAAIQGTGLAGLGINQIPLLNTMSATYASASSTVDEVAPSRGLNIRLVPANGGTIVSIRNEDHVGSSELYVIHESQDIGQELGKIITLHYLKK